jgi:hypothetical protein
MKIANHLFLSSLALSASMIGCNKKSNELTREKSVEMPLDLQDGSPIKSPGQKS